ncbi:syntaphilin, isoform CRA_c, partial [Mus musculus]
PLPPRSPSPSKHPLATFSWGSGEQSGCPPGGSPNHGSLRRLLITARRLLQRLQRRCAKRRGSRASRPDCGGRVDPEETCAHPFFTPQLSPGLIKGSS